MSEKFNIPSGGCLKVTEGTWYQVFDDQGRCVEQRFVTGTDGQYEEADGKVLLPDDPRLNYYQPYSTPNPKMFCPQFTCKSCGGNRLEEIMDDVTLASEIVDVGPGGDMEYGDNSNGDSGTVDRYQCITCGCVVMDAFGQKVTTCDGLALALGVDTGQAGA